MKYKLKKGNANNQAGKPKAASQPTNQPTTLKESFNLYIGGVTNKLLFNDRIRIQRAPLSYIHRSPYIYIHMYAHIIQPSTHVRGTIIVNFRSDKVHCTYSFYTQQVERARARMCVLRERVLHTMRTRYTHTYTLVNESCTQTSI